MGIVVVAVSRALQGPWLSISSIFILYLRTVIDNALMRAKYLRHRNSNSCEAVA